jgi:hypothetical protein
MLRHLTASIVLLAGVSTHAATVFNIELTHSQETTQGALTTSDGLPRPLSFGAAVITLNDDNTALTFTSIITNIDVTGSQTADANDNLTAAHIHVGAPLGMNASVRWGFFGSPDNDNNPDDLVVTPFTTGVGGTFSSKWDLAEGNNTTLDAQIPGILAGLAYLNFHTVQFGGGEIRGQIVPEPMAGALVGLSLLGLMRRPRKR